MFDSVDLKFIREAAEEKCKASKASEEKGKAFGQATLLEWLK